MTQPPPLQTPSSGSMFRTVCQIALWAIVALKAVWLALALTFVGLQWQVLLFGCSLLILAAATWSFATGNRQLALGLAWLGVLLAIAVGYFGGSASSAVTNRIHDQFRNHIADFVFLLIAHVQFWVLGTIAHKPATSADVR